MPYLKLYNSYNDIKFIFDTFTGRISPIDFAIGITNLSISNSNRFTPMNKEIYKALISCVKNV